jgi:hypothetical protein
MTQDLRSNARMHRAFRRIPTLLAIAALFLMSSTAQAAVISSSVSCVLQMCTVEPLGGPVPVDPTGFTLETDWQPQHVELLGVVETGDWWALTLVFDFTGLHDGTEHWGPITLLDQHGVAVPSLNTQFDDTNIVGNSVIVNYQIFNQGADFQNFFLYGLHLALSDGSGVDTMEWVLARFSPAATGITQIPEPSMLLLMGGALAVCLRRVPRGARHVRRIR